jgi:hypothetical protein
MKVEVAPQAQIDKAAPAGDRESGKSAVDRNPSRVSAQG